MSPASAGRARPPGRRGPATSRARRSATRGSCRCSNTPENTTTSNVPLGRRTSSNRPAEHVQPVARPAPGPRRGLAARRPARSSRRRAGRRGDPRRRTRRRAGGRGEGGDSSASARPRRAGVAGTRPRALRGEPLGRRRSSSPGSNGRPPPASVAAAGTRGRSQAAHDRVAAWVTRRQPVACAHDDARPRAPAQRARRIFEAVWRRRGIAGRHGADAITRTRTCRQAVSIRAERRKLARGV